MAVRSKSNVFIRVISVPSHPHEPQHECPVHQPDELVAVGTKMLHRRPRTRGHVVATGVDTPPSHVAWEYTAERSGSVAQQVAAMSRRRCVNNSPRVSRCCPILRPALWGWIGRRPMTALLLGVGALLLAVVAGALLEPRPRNTDRADDLPSMDEIRTSVT